VADNLVDVPAFFALLPVPVFFVLDAPVLLFAVLLLFALAAVLLALDLVVLADLDFLTDPDVLAVLDFLTDLDLDLTAAFFVLAFALALDFDVFALNLVFLADCVTLRAAMDASSEYQHGRPQWGSVPAME
jgi:hypothetical protein